jgi:hypothetical protein
MTGLTPFAQAMPDEYKHEDAVIAYRQYYQSPEKRRLASWKKRPKPEWFQDICDVRPMVKDICDVEPIKEITV